MTYLSCTYSSSCSAFSASRRRRRQYHRQRWIDDPAMAPDDNFAFPIGTTFEYLNEGAANIVYRISIPPRTPLPSLLDEYEDGEPLPEDLDLIPYLLGPFESKLSKLLFKSLRLNVGQLRHAAGSASSSQRACCLLQR